MFTLRIQLGSMHRGQAWPKKGHNEMVKWTTLTFKQLAAQKDLRMDAGYWIKQKEKNDKKNNNRAASIKRPAKKFRD